MSERIKHWNYRVCKKWCNDIDEDIYTIHQVYYDDKGNIVVVSENPAHVMGDSLIDLRWYLAKMREALDKEVIDLDTLFKGNDK